MATNIAFYLIKVVEYLDFTTILCYCGKWSSSMAASLFFHNIVRKKWQAATAANRNGGLSTP